MKFQSSIITAASGSIGGATYSRNRGGMYIRGKGMPTNPNSTRQTFVRGNFASLVNRWTNTLTAAERQAWTDYGKATPYTSVLGEPLELTGQQEYIRTNSLIRQSGGAALDTAPTIFDRGEAINETTVFEVLGDNLTATFTLGSAASAAGVGMLYVGPPQNGSVNFFNGPYQFADFAAFAGDATSITVTADVTDPDEWKAQHIPAVDQFLPIQVRIYYNDGRVPVRYREIIEVAVGE